jgi:hypothetical protein
MKKYYYKCVDYLMDSKTNDGENYDIKINLF